MTVGRVRDWAGSAKRINPRTLCRLLTDIDQALAEDAAAGETTIAVLAVTPGGVVGASVGDSEAWRIAPGGSAEVLTEGRKPFLGSGAARAVGFESGPLAPGDTLLVASDGLFKYTDAEQIGAAVATVEPLDLMAKRLVDLVRLRSGALPDDVSVILCRLA